MRRALAGCGLDEVITYSFIAPDALDPLGLRRRRRPSAPVEFANPMSVEQSVMRTMLLPGLLEAVRDNLARLRRPAEPVRDRQGLPVGTSPSRRRRTPPRPGAMLPHEPEMSASSSRAR